MARTDRSGRSRDALVLHGGVLWGPTPTLDRTSTGINVTKADAMSAYRDYAAEMRRLINGETAEGPYVAAQVAHHIVHKLREIDPDLLQGWLDLQAVEMVRTAIIKRDAATRAHARVTAKRHRFADAAKRFAEGDTEALGGFLNTVHVVEGGLRKRLSEMTGKELKFAADTYGKRAMENALHEAFLRKIAERVSDRQTVGQRFDEERLTKIWLSLAEPEVPEDAKNVTFKSA